MGEGRRVAVIGSGFGGLSLAIRLQSQGYRAVIFEKRDRPGGRAYVYRDEGFTFDAGPTVVTAPDCLGELFALGGRRMEDYLKLVRIDPMYRLHWENGSVFDYTDDLSSTLSQIARFSPADAQRYPRFLEYTRQVFEEGYVKLAHVPFLDWWSMIRVSPQLLRLQAHRTVYGMVSKYLRHPQLRQAFSFHSLLVGGNPFSASSIYTLIHYLERKWGVYFPMGGTGALVEALTRLFLELGGQIRCDSEVDEIVTEEGRVKGVRLKSGSTEAFPLVVSNADVAHTYGRLLRREPRLAARRRRLDRARYSMSLFLVYFGTRRRFPQLAHHNVIFGARYRELLKEIFVRGRLSDDFSLYVHMPTKTDPSLAPEGGEAFYALSPVPHLGRSGVDWKTEGPRYAGRILSYLESRYLPGLRREIVTQRIFTPLDFERELNAHLGSAFSLEPVLSQSAYLRVHNREDRVRGLYFVGAGTHPGAGIPGVVSSAKATAEVIRADQARERIIVEESGGMPAQLEAALVKCRHMIRAGSKSFSLAARLFPKQIRDAACFLYGWCRYCDDEVDRTTNLRLQEERVRALRDRTEAAFRGEAEHPVFVALAHLASRYGIPRHYALELVEGMAMDVRRERYRTPAELGLYCYRVAGTVGLMMAHVMGVSDEAALRHAADLGTAMQLTNIARDVLEDAAMDRVYLPLLWLDEAGVPEGQLTLGRHRDALARVAARLLAEADRFYRSGNAGLKYLPWRAACAVAMASAVYSRIGTLVRRRGARAWDERAVVSPAGKMLAFLRGIRLVARTIPYRLTHLHEAIPIRTVWRHQWTRPEVS